MHDKVVGGVQKGSCACMYNWTDVVSVLITAGQVKYLFLSVQQLPVIAQALNGSKVALLCLTQYVFIVFIFIYVCVYVSSASLPCRSTHASLHILFADGKSGVLLRRESLGRTNP